MQRQMVRLICFFLILLTSGLLAACGTPATPTADPNLVWQVNLSKYEVKDKLDIVVTVKEYMGTTQETHQQAPTTAGDVFLIMDVTVDKQGTQITPFEWNQLTVQDASGKSYLRLANDSFLETFNYAPRMTGLELKLGDNAGWVCYEIPAGAANGKLSLVYSGTGSQQEITIKN